MNLINSTVIANNLQAISNWAGSTTVPDAIDSVTYDLYESSNPFRRNFSKEDITNKEIRTIVNATTAVGAEMFSVFANPYYLSHKIINIPTAYHSVVEAYKKNDVN